MAPPPHHPETATRPTTDARGRLVFLAGLVLLGVTMACAGEAAGKRVKPAAGAAAGAAAGQIGNATYYSPRLAGRKTASGEPYDPAKLTAAHPSLPLGTRVRVTRLDGGSKSVVVRINDRCAGVKKIIDLSEAAARRLDMMRAGIVRVRLVPINAK